MAAIWHPFTQMKTAKPPIEIIKGCGAYLTAKDGRDYLDAISSWWVNLHGHCHPVIAKAIAKQALELEHVLFAGFTHPRALELAERLLPLLPGKMNKLFFTDNGSTAVEVALKMALQYWHNQNITKNAVISFKGGYHGDTFGAMSTAGKGTFNRPFWNYLFDVITITPPTKGNEEQSLEELKKAISNHEVACFIFEPLVQGVAGMKMHSATALDGLLKLCHQKGIITIADEVMTGFGRTGSLFATDQTKEKPSIICLSKGITGGFLPLGVTACTAEIYDAFHSDETTKALLHGHSYTANPLACASALASLDLLQKADCSLQRKMIQQSHERFVNKWQKHPKLVRIESMGTILAIEYVDDTSSYFSKLKDLLYSFFIEKKVILRPLGNVVYILPPYCISQEELTYIYETLALTFEGNLCLTAYA